MTEIGVKLLWLLLIGVVGLVASSLWSSYALEMLTVAVLLNAGATIELWRLWRRTVRRPEELKKEFLKRVFDTKPITPKHQPPPPLKEGYAGGAAGEKEELQFFSDFAEFANVVNWGLGEDARPWRLQELPKADLSRHGVFSHGR